MLKKITALLCLTFSIVLFCMAVSATDAETTDIDAIYVSGTAAEGGTGVVSAPVSTLAAAYTLLGNDGTIYLMDTVSVSVPEGDCFVAPAHTGKITITSADGYNGALDLTNVAHFHFGGETEWNNIGIVANDLVLTADNHTVTMGEGLSMSSETDGITYRGGHAYCDARIHLAAYAPCETANTSLGAAGSELYVHSGEYWSVSAWYGESVTANSGETLLYFGKRAENEEIWVRYLCPGLYSESEAVLTAANSSITVITDEGLNTPEPYRFTKDSFSGNMTVNWLFRDLPQGEATVLLLQDFTRTTNSTCTLNLYTYAENEFAQASAKLFMRGAVNTYRGNNTGNLTLADYEHICETYVKYDGRILCKYCEYEECRHRTSETIETAPANCKYGAEYTTFCTDICGQAFEVKIEGEPDPNYHGEFGLKYRYSDVYNFMAYRCMNCDYRFRVLREDDVPNYIIIGTGGKEYTGSNLPPEEGALHFATWEAGWAYINAAINLMDDLTIEVRGPITIPGSFAMPEFDGHILITGSEDATLYFPGSIRRIYLNGDLTIENVKFCAAGIFDQENTDRSIAICARNHKLIMGDGIVVEKNWGCVETPRGEENIAPTELYVIGGFSGTTAKGKVIDSDITIRSGHYRFVGGWNLNAATNDGKAKMTIGKTNPDSNLYIEYLCPFSRGDGYITQPAETTLVIDGPVTVDHFYVTTLNKATEGIDYITNIVLKGDISGNSASINLGGTADNEFYPNTIVNLFVDSRVETAIEDSYAFFGHPDGTTPRDSSLDRLNAFVIPYDYADYCAVELGGHFDVDQDLICDECEHSFCTHANTSEGAAYAATCDAKGFMHTVCNDCNSVVATLTGEIMIDPTNHGDADLNTRYDTETNCIIYFCAACGVDLVQTTAVYQDIYVSSSGALLSASNLPEGGEGGAQETAFGDFLLAVRYAAASTAVHETVTIHLMDTINVPKTITMSEYSGYITVSGGGLRFNSEDKQIFLGGAMAFEDIDFYSHDNTGVKIFAQNNKLVMGEGIRMCNTDTVCHESWECNSVKMYIYGGFKDGTETEMSTDITIRSGDYWCVGGWNSTHDVPVAGNSKITIGNMNATDKIYITYLIPYSTGDGYVTADVTSTVHIDGEANIKLFFATTQNAASTNYTYTTNVVLQGEIGTDRMYSSSKCFDVCATPTRPLLTTVNVYADSRVIGAAKTASVLTADSTLYRTDTTVVSYTYEEYCVSVLGGHFDDNGDAVCDTCDSKNN